MSIDSGTTFGPPFLFADRLLQAAITHLPSSATVSPSLMPDLLSRGKVRKDEHCYCGVSEVRGQARRSDKMAGSTHVSDGAATHNSCRCNSKRRYALIGTDPFHSDATSVICGAAIGASSRQVFLGSVLHDMVKTPDADAVVARCAQIRRPVGGIHCLHAQRACDILFGSHACKRLANRRCQRQRQVAVLGRRRTESQLLLSQLERFDCTEHATNIFQPSSIACTTARIVRPGSVHA